MNPLHRKYIKEQCWGLSTALDLHACNPHLLRSKDLIKEFVVELCKLIKVKPFGDCTIVKFGEREEISGYSMIQLIESSLVSGHFAESSNSAFIDIFSCKYYDPNIVADFCKDYFEAKSYIINYIFRK